jgi:hypothetical protein
MIRHDVARSASKRCDVINLMRVGQRPRLQNTTSLGRLGSCRPFRSGLMPVTGRDIALWFVDPLPFYGDENKYGDENRYAEELTATK